MRRVNFMTIRETRPKRRTSNDPTVLMSTFLRKLAKKIEKGELTDPELFKVCEFFVSYLFNQEMNTLQEQDDKEFWKFITLGWWVYKYIIPINC